jgi:hypothetical protein
MCVARANPLPAPSWQAPEERHVAPQDTVRVMGQDVAPPARKKGT